jgi:hypothetical protein
MLTYVSAQKLYRYIPCVIHWNSILSKDLGDPGSDSADVQARFSANLSETICKAIKSTTDRTQCKHKDMREGACGKALAYTFDSTEQ